MGVCTVTFLPHNLSVSATPGETVIRAAMRAGVHINASCGGEGICGKCRILIDKGQVSNGLSDKLTPGEIEKGLRLACKSQIIEDVSIIIPLESSKESDNVDFKPPPRNTITAQPTSFPPSREMGLPSIEKIHLQLPPPTNQNNTPDATRLLAALKQQTRLDDIDLPLEIIQKLPGVIRQNNYSITATLIHSAHNHTNALVAHLQPGDHATSSYAISLDLGTTTIYGKLVNLSTGETLAERGIFNPQVSFGEDVISRIVHAEKPGGLKEIQQLVIRSINSLLNDIILKADISEDNISALTMAGNTTMTQLLLGIDPRFLRRAPYVPASTYFPDFKAIDLGITLGQHMRIFLFPCISSYVGGDIVAGVIASGMVKKEETTLYLDIGTNAEIVLGNQDWLVCTACSAGPAFEGGGIEFGMHASKGAIEDFSMDPQSLEPMLLTVENSLPRGICGSGLITITATLFEMGIIDNLGRFNRDLDTNRVRQVSGIYQYVLAWKEDSAIDRDIVLTELDIENLIRAKGAIYSGCMTLLHEVGLEMEMIDRIILAGGFGSYIDLEKAMVIGLLPEVEAEKVTFIGNGSLTGTTMSLTSSQVKKDIVEITEKMTNFELSETSSYMDNYVAALFIPHTDIRAFPMLKKRMDERKSMVLNN